MFGLKRKIKKWLSSRETKTEGTQIWVVSWDARYGSFHYDFERVSKAFFSKEDAENFKESLLQAKGLLQYGEELRIKVEKQK